MTLKTVISNVKTVKAGDSIGYGCEYIAKSDMKIATVSIGYADGYPRHLSNKGIVLVGGKRARIVGNVCMDQCVIDISGIDFSEGDVGTGMGKDGDDCISVDELSSNAGTIPNELLCLFSERVRRIYID